MRARAVLVSILALVLVACGDRLVQGTDDRRNSVTGTAVLQIR